MGRLAEIFKDDFDSDVRWRGDRYYKQRAVKLQTLTDDILTAKVSGTQEYRVEINLSKATCRCTCPYFQTAGPCKHVWATIREADDRNVEISRELMESVTTPAPVLAASRPPYKVNLPPPKPRPQDLWQQNLQHILSSMELNQEPSSPPLPEGSQVQYCIDLTGSSYSNHLLVKTLVRRPGKRDGALLAPKALKLKPDILPSLADADRQIVMALLGASPYYSYGYYGSAEARDAHGLSVAQQEMLLPQMARTGRCFYRVNGKFMPLQLDEGPAWQLTLDVLRNGKCYDLHASLRRDEERRSIDEPVAVLSSGWVIWPDALARYDGHQSFSWVNALREQRAKINVPIAHGTKLLEKILHAKHVPALTLPPELQYTEVAPPCKPLVKVAAPNGNRLPVSLLFDYEGMTLTEDKVISGVYEPKAKRWVRRDSQAEDAAAKLLTKLGARLDYNGRRLMAPRNLPAMVRELLDRGWRVEAEGRLYRHGGKMGLSVSSGVDWLEVQGQADFDGHTASLPDILAALRKGEKMVVLSDGSMGMLPEEWLEQYGLLAATGKAHGDTIRFKPTQTMLLDAMLADLPVVSVDEAFEHARQEAKRFMQIEPAAAPETFIGTLREYQNEGLGWLHFLRQFDFGGCLADDMGLGKTIQVLALLEARRLERAAGGKDAPKESSLVVVPRSLVFNWLQEASKFTPGLRVLDHSHCDRAASAAALKGYDLILTTYGTLRRDIEWLKDVAFDYTVLDEAQTIKNPDTASAKAARLLKGRHRLCLSGTPIENHLGELWSQLEFLNPGLLGSWTAFGMGRDLSVADRKALARAVRPFILRRTKEQVAKELPSRTEQTIACELDTPQRKLYNQLRDHYRTSVLAKVAGEGLGKSKMHILEALLRLRQAACHPGLIDKSLTDQPSAKLDALLAQLQEVTEEGHKALVFSQFTTFLGLVRKRLDEQGIVYEYLDGRTRDRQAHVERFQGDGDCRVFLISLKAGGLGLNLTAAEYVFLLDPWWNPAVEAQAIDRAHRIGQTRRVFAYRLIAQDTIEEKVLQLQQSKRELADSIITADNSLIRDLTREDLEMLLT